MKSPLFVILITLLTSSFAMAVDNPPALSEAVTAFWDASVKKDKVTSMQFVHPEDLNNYLNKKGMAIQKWSISEISLNEDQSEASVVMDFAMETYPGVIFNLSRTDTWQKADNQWKIRVDPPSKSAAEALLGGREAGKGNSPPKTLSVRPDTIKFYKVNPKQPAFIWIENGLAIPAEPVTLKVDEALIKIVEKPETVAPGERARIRLEYIGGEKEMENLVTEITLEIKSGEEITSHTIKAVYNYMNAAMRWIQKKQQGADPQP